MALDLHLSDHSSHRALFEDYPAVEELIVQFLEKGEVAISEEGREHLLELCIGVV